MGYSIFTIRTFDLYNTIWAFEDCMKKFFESLREHAMKIINFENKKMISITNKQQESYLNPKICYIFKIIFEDKNNKDKDFS